VLLYEPCRVELDISGVPSSVEKMKGIPQIVIHGDADATVPVEGSRAMVEEVKGFGGEDPLGRIVSSEKGRILKVTGIVEDIPGNTHLKFDYLISFLTMYSLREDIDTSWGIMNYTSYIQLQDRVSAGDFGNKLPAIVAKYHDRDSKHRRYFLS
jgi:hypothetical protein